MRGLARSRGGGNGGKRESCCRHRQRTATPPPAVRWTGASAPRRSSHWRWSGQRRCGAARFAVGACTQRGRTPHPQRASVVDPRAAAAAGAPRPLLLTSRRQSPLDPCPRASVLAAHSVHASPPPRSLCTLPYDAAAGRTGSSQPAMKVLVALASVRELPAQASTASPFRRGQSKRPSDGSSQCSLCSHVLARCEHGGGWRGLPGAGRSPPPLFFSPRGHVLYTWRKLQRRRARAPVGARATRPVVAVSSPRTATSPPSRAPPRRGGRPHPVVGRLDDRRHCGSRGGHRLGRLDTAARGRPGRSRRRRRRPC